MAAARKTASKKPVENAFTVLAARLASPTGTGRQAAEPAYVQKTVRIPRPGGGMEIRFPDNWHKQTGEKDPHPKSGPQFRTNWHPEA